MWQTLLEWASNALLVFLGLASGVAVGSGLVAFLVVLDVIPRLAQISDARERGATLETAVVFGAVFCSVAGLMDWSFHLPIFILTIVGILTGAFVGTIAAALTEVLNVFPILTRRLRIEHFLIWLLAAMVLGKVIGSLFEWLVFRI
jgi:stage V sporulation protein AB